jgi:hypothetical protein
MKERERWRGHVKFKGDIRNQCRTLAMEPESKIPLVRSRHKMGW